MYQEKKHSKYKWIIRFCVCALCLVILFCSGTVLWHRTQSALTLQAAQSVRTAVLDAAVQCYVLEGAYPKSLTYLEEHYGVQINHKLFIVSYDVFASNQLPNVAVLNKKQ